MKFFFTSYLQGSGSYFQLQSLIMPLTFKTECLELGVVVRVGM